MHYQLLYILVTGVVSVCLSSPCLAQSSPLTAGARGQAMGNATACLSDEWSVMNNVAGLAGITSVSFGTSYDALPSMPAFGKAGFVFSVPGIVASGLALNHFGDAGYSEQVASIGAATKWRHTAVGAKLNYIRYAAIGMGSKSLISISFGGITQLSSWLSVGATISNLNQPWLSKDYGERLPTTLTAGVLLSLAPEVIVTVDIEKRVNDVATGRAGLELTVYKKVIGRVGFQIQPQAITGGLGYKLRYFRADYSMSYIPLFGTRLQATATFSLRRSKARPPSSISTR